MPVIPPELPLLGLDSCARRRPLHRTSAKGARDLYSGIIAAQPSGNRNYVATSKLDTDTIADGWDKE
jgi:hypothetical protein